MRRLAAALVLIAALATTAVLWLLPVTISVLGTSGSCGVAIYTAFASNTDYGPSQMDQELAPECRAQGLPESIVGGIIGVAGVAASIVLWRMDTNRWPAHAVWLRRELMGLHHQGGDGLCPSCRVAWPCASGRAVLMTITRA